MHKISLIFGTRPEAIKLAPVILALQRHPDFDCRVCVTAQHREMLDQVLEAFAITPDADLNLMRPNQTLSALTARAMVGLDSYLAEEKPDMVMVQGDTTTVFCAALAAFYHHIPVGHVEAGLRTGDLSAPWPEEANRVLASHLTTLHFAPTETSRRNLLRERVPAERIVVTGNTVIDALFLALEKVRSDPPVIPGLEATNHADSNGAPVVLITGHRRESFGPKFESICQAIAELGRRFPAARFIYPVHLNPNVRGPVNRLLGAASSRNIHLLDPLPYLPFVHLMDRATIILTDSGGIQEEAPSLGKPVLVMRDTTERPEGLASGNVAMVGTDFDRIVSEVSLLLTVKTSYGKMPNSRNPYGDGKASQRIVQALAKHFNRQ